MSKKPQPQKPQVKTKVIEESDEEMIELLKKKKFSKNIITK